MKTHKFAAGALTALLVAAFGQSVAFSQLTLTGTSYTQNFNDIGSGLPVGWTARTGATASDVGTSNNFNTGTTMLWKSATSGQFWNFASVISNEGTNFISTEDAATQGAATNRAPGLRIANAINPGAAFVLQIQDTMGATNFMLDFDILTLNTNARTYTWTIDCAVGAAPSSFTTLGTFTDTNVFGASHLTYPLPAAVNNQANNLWIRLALLTGGGSGTHDVFGIDNVALAWSLAPLSTDPPSVDTEPQSRTNNAGTVATFTVTTSGAGPMLFQWRKGGVDLANGGNISGATNSALTISSVVAADVAGYSVFVTNNYGSVTSQVANLTVIDPVVLTSPVSRTNILGDNATFTASFAGTQPMTYQWRQDGVDVAGATEVLTNINNNNTLRITNVQPASLGAYTVVVSNASGVVTSAVANLTLLTTPPTRIAAWNFNSNPSDANTATGPGPDLDPVLASQGTGTASALGTTPSYLAGSVSDPASFDGDNSGWHIKDYPPQGNENKLRGVQFSVSTVGFQNILVTWEELNNARCSRYSRLQYTTDGANFVDHNVIDLGGRQNEFTLCTGDLSGIPGVTNNPNFGFRIVAEFESTAIGSANANYVPTETGQTYGNVAGAIRFDVVYVFGNPPPMTISNIAVVGGNVQIDFTAGTGDVTGNFTLQSSGTVHGTYGDVASTITQLSPGVFRAERALSGSQQFYRIRR